MTHLPALTTEPRHSSGGAGGVARAETTQPPWHSQMIKLPKRIWGSGHYSHGAVRYAAQVIALDQRGRRCRAGVATLAGYLGDGKRTAERHLAELAAPGPDGVAEMWTIRHTHPGGQGATAERRMRPLARGEHFAIVPVGAAKTLRPVLFVAYCALAYAEATRTPVTAGELAALLGVTERSARRLIDALQALGWITVERRAGHQGRHHITVHPHPLHPVTDGPHDADTDGGSGPDTDGGSLAIKEDPGLTDGRNSTQAGGSFRRRRGDRKWVAAPVDTAGNSDGCNYPVAPVPPALRGPVRPAAPPAHAGPPLTLSPRVWAVLEPVRDLLPHVSPYLVRRIAQEAGRQLDAGVLAADLADQLRLLRAWTPTEDIRDIGRWILGAALPVRPGRCGRPDCIRGIQRYTHTPCKDCAQLEDARGRAAHPPHTTAAAPELLACPGCDAPYRPPVRHPCRLCGTDLPTHA